MVKTFSYVTNCKTFTDYNIAPSYFIGKLFHSHIRIGGMFWQRDKCHIRILCAILAVVQQYSLWTQQCLLLFKTVICNSYSLSTYCVSVQRTNIKHALFKLCRLRRSLNIYRSQLSIHVIPMQKFIVSNYHSFIKFKPFKPRDSFEYSYSCSYSSLPICYIHTNSNYYFQLVESKDSLIHNHCYTVKCIQ